MEITCSQMDVLLSFYIEGDLSKTLKNKVEEHLKKCPTCRAKYDILKSMINDIQSAYHDNFDEDEEKKTLNEHYKIFKNNLSAYIDNELSAEDNIKIKKYTINNKLARQDLEDNYNIRRLMSESFKKTKSDTKQDFSKNVIKQICPKEEYNLSFNPILKIGFAFIMSVLVISAIVLFSLTI